MCTLKEFNTNSFTFCRTYSEFTTEASDLGPSFRALIARPADAEFALRSAKTGNVLTVKISGVEYDDRSYGSGDIIAWHFRPVKDYPNFTVTVFND